MTESNLTESRFFPPVSAADENGILLVTENLNVDMLIDAYARGIFPWPADDAHILWCSPPARGVLPLDEFHVPRSVEADMKNPAFEFKVNRNFDKVIDACAETPRTGQNGTWITPKLAAAYKYFYRCGYAHSFEAYDEHGELAGGMYGVSVGRIFCGESMFFRETGASKFALVKAVEYLKTRNVVLLDTQMVTPTTALFGAREIPRAEYMKLLSEYGGLPLRL